MTLKERAAQMKKIQSQLPETLAEISRNATIAAIEKAAELTPPTVDDLAGTGTRSGGMKQHWDTDSQKKPEVSGNEYRTVLANNKKYASYVNDGHRMNKHFVPGLGVNPYTGQLEKTKDGTGGIVVGTKTAYVGGLFMVDQAKKAYQETIETEARKKIEKLFKS